MMGKVTIEAARSDIGAFVDFLDDGADVDATRIGTTGYCMGGRLSLTAASSVPRSGRRRRVVPRRPPRDRCAGQPPPGGRVDRRRGVRRRRRRTSSFTDEHAAALDAALTEAGVDHTVEIYPALHGFAVPDNLTYDDAAADRHWHALETLYAANLTAERARR